MDHLWLMLPFTASFLFVISNLCSKRAMDLGFGVLQSVFLTVWGMTLFFIPLVFWIQGPIPWNELWKPCLCGLLRLLAQLTILWIYRKGDVSVVSPVLGSKVLIVSILVVILLGETLTWTIWTAAALAVGALIIMQDFSGRHPHLLQSVLLSLLAATLLSLVDVLFQKWSPSMGFPLFGFVTFFASGLFALGLIPFFKKSKSPNFQLGLRWSLLASALIGLQAFLFMTAIGIWGNAAKVNIVYSLRGLWSVLLVWMAGHWFSNTEMQAGRSIMIRRLIGAALLFAAAALVLGS